MFSTTNARRAGSWGSISIALTLGLCILASATACGEEAGSLNPNPSPAAIRTLLPTNTVAPFDTPSPGNTGEGVVVTHAPATPTPKNTDAPPDGPVLLRHHEPLLVNHGETYVYGELLRVDDCLRVSYPDRVVPTTARDGLLVVWPQGFSITTQDGRDAVLDDTGVLAAKVGHVVRISGFRLDDARQNWDWGSHATGHCSGPFWVVGDEVTATSAVKPDTDADSEILFKQLSPQRGPVVSPLAGLEGQLVLRGRCLAVSIPGEEQDYLVIWPPGFRAKRSGAEVIVFNGGGNMIVKTGDTVMLGGRDGKGLNTYGAECHGEYFMAHTVRQISPPNGGSNR